MKKLILPLVMLTMAAAPAAAQIVRSTTFTKVETPKVVKEPSRDYDLLGFYYDMEHFAPKYDGPDPDAFNANGFQFKYLHGFSVSKSLPMFVEFGASLSYGISNQEDEDGYVNNKRQFMNIAIPVNFAYRFNLTNSIAIKPFIGLNIKANILARTRNEYTDKYMDKYGDYVDEQVTDWKNLFSDDEYDGVGNDDLTWNRFQVGWHLGVDFQFSSFMIGLNYGTDFNPIFKYEDNKIATSTFNVGFGFVF